MTINNYIPLYKLPRLKRRKMYIGKITKKHHCKQFVDAVKNDAIKENNINKYVEYYYINVQYEEYGHMISDYLEKINYCPFCGKKFENIVINRVV